jgi:putative transposase
MARLARLVVPGLPHYVSQRALGRTRVFAGPADYRLYVDLLAEHCRAAGVEIWAWCLLPSAIHLILVPQDRDGLRRALATAHRRYAGQVQSRRGRSGQFWRGRFSSVAMDEAHLAAAFRQLMLAPVRAGLARRPENWRWSSARAHITAKPDGLASLAPSRKRFGPAKAFLSRPADAAALKRLLMAESIGRPVGSAAFLARLEKRFKRPLAPAKRGPKPRKRKGRRGH